MITAAPPIISAEGIQQRELFLSTDFSSRLLCLPMREFLSGAEVDRAITTMMSNCA